jgi:hypothetical protein
LQAGLARRKTTQLLATRSLISHYVSVNLLTRPMPTRVAALLVCLCGSFAAGACFLSDLFETAGQGAVTFQWTGDSVLTTGVPRPIRVTLMVDGVPVSEPQVELTIPDTTVIRFRTTHDSIVGCRSGRGNVVASVRSSLSPFIDSVFSVRANGGPACP